MTQLNHCATHGMFAGELCPRCGSGLSALGDQGRLGAPMPQAISPPGEPIPSETLNELASFLMQAAATPWDVARGDEHEVARRIAKAAVEAMQSRQWWRLAFIEALRAQEPQTTPKVTEYNPMQAAAQAAAKATYEAIMNAPMSNCLGSPPKP